MQYHEFQNGVKIPMIGFGTFPLKGEVLSAAIKDAINIGYGLLDTATGYNNESEIGSLVEEGVIKFLGCEKTGWLKRYVFCHRMLAGYAFQESGSRQRRLTA